ncbi:MAG: hypothetical protein DVB31_12380 [Verrucomicrobia bacterium]|nr:MAG: hypothetical protein DVB31_12380 [Verrucomicrobiota bacterium]
MKRTWFRGMARFLGCGLVAVAACARADFQGATHLMPFDEETLAYSKSPDTSSVARLQKRIDAGEVTLKKDARFGYLLSVLEALGVPRASQMLVFSKTSFQRDRIAPSTPRALYYNDGVYIGYVAGSPLLEVSAVDAKLGAVFYTMEQKETAKPRFVRTDNCTECHASAKTMGVPGHLVRSFQTDESGMVDLLTGVDFVNHRTALADRWGGWYVTGTHGAQLHRGNLIGKDAFDRQLTQPNHSGNVTDLGRFIDTGRYPEPGSDIVALMVMEHQTHMHNFITRLAYEAKIQLSAYGHANYLKSATEAFVKYLLFAEEAPLVAPIRGRADFAANFSKAGPRDRRGRSLRDFDLNTRLFKYPCSYLVYSDSFDALPDPVKEKLYRRIYEILTGRDDTDAYARLTPSMRREILEILADTKPSLPSYWRQSVRESARKD